MITNDRWQHNISMTMDSLIIGTGWQEVERDDNIYYRWTGPDNAATLHLNPVRNRDNRLNLTIYSATSESALSELSLEADGVTLHTVFSKKRNPAYLTSILPADKSKKKNEKTVLTFKLPKDSSPSFKGNIDQKERSIGVALSKITIFPLTRALFSAQKYSDPIPFDGIYYMRQHPHVRDAVIQGIYPSAYEYYQKYSKSGFDVTYDLHDDFDECPGDLFDILRADMSMHFKDLEENFNKEITFLRDIVIRQGDSIRSLKSQK